MIALGPLPQTPVGLSITSSAVDTDVGLPVTFDADASESGPLTYVWGFGDGTTSPLAAPSHTYESSGNQTVTLHVYAANGSSGFATTTVSVAFALSVAGPNSPPQGTIDSPVSFGVSVQSGVPAYSYYWTFGDLNSSRAVAPSHSFSRPGTYQVTVFVNDSAGGQAQYSELVLITASHGSTGDANSSMPLTHPVYLWISGGFAIAAAAIIIAVGYSPRRR